MRIFLVHNFYGSTAPSGENTVVLEEAQLLRQAGHEVIEHFVSSDSVRLSGGRIPESRWAIIVLPAHIPAVCDIKDATTLLMSGEHVLVDAETGTVTAAPTQAQSARFADDFRRTLADCWRKDGLLARVEHSAAVEGVKLTLAADPTFKDYAPHPRTDWRGAAVAAPRDTSRVSY